MPKKKVNLYKRTGISQFKAPQTWEIVKGLVAAKNEKDAILEAHFAAHPEMDIFVSRLCELKHIGVASAREALAQICMWVAETNGSKPHEQ